MSVLQLSVPTVRHKNDVLLDILLHDEPRTAAQAKSLPLSDGVEPEAFVLADDLARLDIYNLALLLAHEATDEVVVVYLSEEADTLTVLASGTRKFGIERYLSHLVLHEMPYREECVAELFVAELRKEVRLVLDRVFCCAEPHLAISYDICGIMARCDIIVMTTHLLFERAELDKTVAHHVRIRRQSFLDALDGIAHNLLPVLFLQVSNLELQPILSSRSLRKFDVLFCRTRRILPVHTYLNIV